MRSGAEEAAIEAVNWVKNAKNVSCDAKNTYYFSHRGSDSNDGRTPERPFLSPEKLCDLDLKPGDAVLFERNSEFRVTTTLPLKEGVFYGAYGEGKKPQFIGSPYNFNTRTWVACGNSVWKIDFQWENVGLVFINGGEIVGQSMLSVEDLREDGDFHLDAENHILYVKSSVDPSRYASVEISVGRLKMFAGRADHVRIDNLCVMLAAVHGIQLVDSQDIEITNCELKWIGGALQQGTQLFGNGIEFWSGVSNAKVVNNWFYQIFDAAFTFQGSGQFENITFTDNVIEYSTLSIEWWGKPRAEKNPTTKINNILINRNIVRLTGYGWGRRRRDIKRDAHIVAGQGVYDYTDIVTNFVIEDNIFDCAYTNIFYHVWDEKFTKRVGTDYIIRHNSYYQRNRTGKDDLGYGTGKNNAFRFGGVDTHGEKIWAVSEKNDHIATYASNQAELEAAVAAVDPSPRTVKWLDF